MSTAQSSLFPPSFPAVWASEWGEDRFGLFMVLELKGIRQQFRWITPGTFLMGSPEQELERSAERETQHQVTLTKGFWLADSACTQELWLAVMPENPSRFQKDAHNPVETVSWHDARQFTERLNEIYPELQAGLPTEAQWEYACRAGTTTAFSFGENIIPEQVNYDGEYPYADGSKGLNREKTVRVKSLPPNPWGLYEMHGNVWEWCQDWYGDYGSEAVVDPDGPQEGANRVMRGGSWDDYGRSVRSAHRSRYEPVYRSSTGFRLALS